MQNKHFFYFKSFKKSSNEMSEYRSVDKIKPWKNYLACYLFQTVLTKI